MSSSPVGREASLNRLVEILRSVGANAKSFAGDQVLCEALRSQGSIARYSSDEAGIVGMALNTQKALANRHLGGGYETLNEARLRAIDAMASLDDTPRETSPDTKESLKKRLAEKDDLIARLELDLGLVTHAFDKLRASADSIIASVSLSGKYDLWKKELRVVLSGLSLRHIDSGNVASFKRK